MSTPFAARLPDETVAAIKGLVESGKYKSQAAVVVAAVNALCAPADAIAGERQATPKERAVAVRAALACHPNEAVLGRRSGAEPFSRDAQAHRP